MTLDPYRRSLATLPGCNTLMMRNHGAITMGRTVAEAFVLMYYLERVCALQLKVMAASHGGSSPIHWPDKAVMKKASQQACVEFPAGEFEWAALKAMILKEADLRSSL